jgi:lipoprotein-releasing system ATP-binding protein
VLRHIVDEHGKTVVAVTHHLGLAERMDRQIQVVDGAIVADEVTAGRKPAAP